MYTFYEYPKCSTCRKAKAELDQLGLDVESINIKENPPSAQFLKELLEGSEFRNLRNSLIRVVNPTAL
mgnify:CR=1 FL=1